LGRFRPVAAGRKRGSRVRVTSQSLKPQDSVPCEVLTVPSCMCLGTIRAFNAITNRVSITPCARSASNLVLLLGVPASYRI
jgi:hypothetical protein